MTPDQELFKLVKDTELAASHQSAWDNVFLPFFEGYQERLFESFRSVSATDKEGLLIIKLQTLAVDSLRAHLEHYIVTGRLAEMRLAEINPEPRGNH